MDVRGRLMKCQSSHRNRIADWLCESRCSAEAGESRLEGWIHHSHKTIQLRQQINHVERTQWSWTESFVSFGFGFCFCFLLFVFGLVFSSIFGPVTDLWWVLWQEKKCARSRLQAAEVLFYFYFLFFGLSSAFRLGLFVVVIWEVFRMSLIWRLHDCIKSPASTGRLQSGRTPADAFTDKLNFVFADTLLYRRTVEPPPLERSSQHRRVSRFRAFATCRRFRMAQK